ncbi:MAG: metal-dependent hydrolase [Candidatus Acidiferrales bacterium]
MEAVTHALTSLALARAAGNRLPRFGAAMVVVSGVAADIDYLSYFGGPGAFLNYHRAALHSLLGSILMISAIAAVFWRLDRTFPKKNSTAGLQFMAAIAYCSLGAAWHLLFDLCSGEAVQLFWPFRITSSAWNFTVDFDPWIFVLILAGLLLPQLLRLVNEEIGDRGWNGGRRGARIALVIVLAYLGTRGILRRGAAELLRSREYHGRAPLIVGAFPDSVSPFEWRGVVLTDDTIEELEVSLAPGAEFDPDRSVTHIKPEESPALVAGESNPIARRFLEYARFPLASVSPLDNGTRFELRDLQFAREDRNPANISVRVDFDTSLQVKQAEYRFGILRQR